MAETNTDGSRALAESSRQKQWKGESFLRELFMGNYRLELLEALNLDVPNRPEFWTYFERMRTFLVENVDPASIDEEGEYPPEVVDGLRDLGAFGLKIPSDYGGLGLSHVEYVTLMKLIGSYDANVTALLSAHQAIGVPQPVRLFGTSEQKREFLPRCAKGAISAFALTEPAVGSDPARLQSVAEPTEDGEAFLLSGHKLWCTNGTLAELIVVMARNPKTNRINAFVVETEWEGVQVEKRCRFMGLRALANAFMSFDRVRVPRSHLLGEEGDGLKIALVTLNTGRLTLPAATAGLAAMCEEIVRKWSNARVQWGQEIGKHEAVAHANANIARSAFAMDSVSLAVGELADDDRFDLRLEAAAAKEWNTVQAWELIDQALQVRGGRGYETERSLRDRGETPVGTERAMRDARINMIFEGSSEVMHLFIAREAVDRHLDVAETLVDAESSFADKLRALPRVMGFYAWWYPSRYLGWGRWPRYARYGRLGRHLRFAERMSRKLARSMFHAMARHRAGLEKKQGILFRAVDIGIELFVLTTTVIRASRLAVHDGPAGEAAEELAELHARMARRRVRERFRALRGNDDAFAYGVGRKLLDGRYDWLERGIMGVPASTRELMPATVSELLAEEESGRRAEGEAA